MKFVTFFDAEQKEKPGVVHDGAVHALADLGFARPDMLALIDGYTPALGADIAAKAAKAGPGIPVAEVKLQAPIPRPRHDILCIGQNYLAHALEGARYHGKDKVFARAEYPTYFSKRVTLPVGQDGGIPAHADATAKLDYEAELAVVIGRRMSHVPADRVFEYIFGYTIVNDVSARDRQTNHIQYTYGKGMDGFAPMGPWIVTIDEFQSPPLLHVKSRVNGEDRQNGHTGDFLFDIPYLLSDLTLGMTLEPGDILITGTPAGVGMGFTPPKFLNPGDVVECEVEGIGVLRNTVKSTIVF